MRGFLSHVPLLVAASASAHLISITIPNDQGGLKEGVAPDPLCYWSGTAPFCQGSCGYPYSECSRSDYGDGSYCVTGIKKLCCQGSCPGKVPALQGDSGKLVDEVIKSQDRPTAKDDHDDYCPPGKRILCPPGAKHNKECECLDDKAGEGIQQKKAGL